MKIPLLLLTSAFAGAACADVVEASSRVEQVEYHDNLVVKIAGYADLPLVIELPVDEPIADATDAQEAGYDTGKKGTRLFVRPRPRAKPTTILVWTKSRSYVIDLSVGAPKGFANRTSKVVITLPRPNAASAAPEQPMRTAQQATPQSVKGTPSAPGVEAPACARAADRAEYRNVSYSLQVVSETADIRPREAFDNGRFTYLKFPNNVEIPAIFRSVPGSREEVVVNSHKECDYIVLHAVAPLWTLRLGGSVLGVFNDGYEPEGVPSTRGTTVPGAQRVLK